MFYQDRNLACADCGNSFVFTSGEQEFHASKGFSSDPRRCPDCRAARKANGGGNSGGGHNDRYGGGGGRPQREMHDAVCANCGKVAQVPFRPTEGRPVYCSDCFTPAPRGRY